MSKKSNKAQKRQMKILPMVLFFGCAAVVIAICINSFIEYKKKSYLDRKAWDDSSEGYLLQHASVTPVHPLYRPVLIYRYRGNEKRAAYTLVGTWINGINGPVVVTVEHLLLPKFSNELFMVRFLSPDEHTATNGITKIACKNIQVGVPEDDDTLFLCIEPVTANRLPCLSKHREDNSYQMKSYFFNELDLGGRKVRHLKSLVTGEEYPIAGAVKSPQRVLIRFKSQPGYSGTGFVDEYGSLYVLSGGTKEGYAMLSGPYSNIQKHF